MSQVLTHKFRSVTVELDGSTHTYTKARRVFHNSDNSVTIMATGNTPAVARHKRVRKLSYTY